MNGLVVSSLGKDGIGGRGFKGGLIIVHTIAALDPSLVIPITILFTL